VLLHGPGARAKLSQRSAGPFILVDVCRVRHIQGGVARKGPPARPSRTARSDKPLAWLSGELKTPPLSGEARVEGGVLLRRLQRGETLAMPESRPMPVIGPRCHELRIEDVVQTGTSARWERQATSTQRGGGREYQAILEVAVTAAG
jgi:hypothetical protein